MTNTAVREKIVSLIGEEGISQAFAPIEQASGLPNAAYWSGMVRIGAGALLPSIVGVCRGEAEIPDAGDVKPIEIGGAPLMIVRDGAGTVRTFTMCVAIVGQNL